MILGFTGTKDPPGMTRERLIQVVQIFRDLKPSEFHHGDCVVSDAQAHLIALKLNIPVIIHPPIKTIYRAYCDPGSEGKILPSRDYLDRNHDIVDVCDVLLATPKEEVGETLRSGTWATVRYARSKGKRVIIVRPSGVVERNLP